MLPIQKATHLTYGPVVHFMHALLHHHATGVVCMSVCLSKIAGIKWQDRVPNTEVLRLCGISGTEAFLLAAQLRWVGHVVRMEDDRIPKQVFYGQLSSGKRPQCGPVRRYKDTVKANIKRCGLRPQSLSTAPFDRAPHASWPPCHLMSRGLPSWTRNGQLASSRSSTPPARFGRATDAAGPTHHGLGSLPISVPIGDAVRRIRRCIPCACVWCVFS